MKMKSFLATLLVVIPGLSFAASLGGVANTVIDQAQSSVVEIVAGAAVTGFFGVLTWIGATLRIKVVEHFNRETMLTAATNFANFAVDQLQARFLGSETDPIDVSDLIEQGIDYIKAGNPDAVKQSGISDDRLGKLVNGAMNDAMGKMIGNLSR